MKELWGKMRSAGAIRKLLSASSAALAKLKRLWKRPLINNIVKSVTVVALLGILTVTGRHYYTDYVESNTIDIYHVYFADQYLGAVSDPNVVEGYVIDRTREIVDAHPDAHMVVNSDQISIQSERLYQATYDDEQVIEHLSELLTATAVGVELIINGEVYAVLKDQETVDQILDQVATKYIPEDSKKITGDVQILSVHNDADELGQAQLQTVGFEEDIETRTTEIDPSELDSPEEVLHRIETGGVKPTKYIVKEGDTIYGIARRFDLNPQHIYDRNPWIVDDFLQIGDEMDLTVLQPDLTVRTQERVTEELPIRYKTEYISDPTLRKGMTVTVKPGVDGLKRVTYLVTKLNGEMTKEELIDELVLQEPVTAVVKRGTLVIKGVGTGSFSWPVSNPRITSKFGPRWGRTHRGIDVVSSNRTIKAADNGKVSFAGEKSSYGNVVIIDHGNGYETVYAHLKSISVKKGDTVQKGDKLGVMGNTGNSTGVHLHFEIIKNGKHQNPLSYLN